MKIAANEESIQKMLKYAFGYSLFLGLFLVFFPKMLFTLMGLEFPNYIELWQYIGLMFGFLGIGYFIASFEPTKYWQIILIGFLSNIAALIFISKAYFLGKIPLNFYGLMFLILFVWVIPFYRALLFAYEANTLDDHNSIKFIDLIKVARTSAGESLYSLSEKENILLVFVRHFGCTFCRETVSEIAKLETSIKGKKLTPVFVHMSDPSFADEFFSKYYNHPVHHVSDPQRFLYKSLKLKRGSLNQLFGFKIWIRGLWAGIFKGHGIGAIEGDALQLGGFFILSRGQIVFEHKSSDAADFFELQLLP